MTVSSIIASCPTVTHCLHVYMMYIRMYVCTNICMCVHTSFQVVYARKDLGADIILDMATLTGAQGISTGRYHGALLTNSEEWEGSVVQAGKNSGDLVVSGRVSV